MRLDSPKVAVLITDGESNSFVDYLSRKLKFRAANIKLLVVGIGNVNKFDLLQLVATPEDLLLVTDFDALEVTDFVEHTTFCEPDACACEAPLRQKLDELLHGQNQINSELTLLREESEAIRNHVEPETHPLTLQGARNACKEFGDGWAFGHETSASLRCFKAPATVKSNCNDCSSFRILVWEDGADEYGPNSKHTVAGQYYGGHSPCSSYTNVPYCGVWGTG